MTTAKLRSAPPANSGLTESMCSRLYADRLAGRPAADIPVVGVIRVVEDYRKSTAKGEKTGVVLEFLHLEPVDGERGGRVDTVRLILEEEQGRRHTPQQRLPLDFGQRPDEDQRLWLLEQIHAWAESHDFDPVEQWWMTHDKEHTAPLDKASATLLRGFAIEKGIVGTDDGQVAEPEATEDGEDPA